MDLKPIIVFLSKTFYDWSDFLDYTTCLLKKMEINSGENSD